MELARPIPDQSAPWSAAVVAPARPGLNWLPPPPADWGARLRAAADWAELTALARYRLDALATLRLDRRMRAIFDDTPPDGAVAARVAVLASSTAEHLSPSLRVGLARHGIWACVHTGAYGCYAQELLDEGGALQAFRPDTVLFALDARHVAAWSGPNGSGPGEAGPNGAGSNGAGPNGTRPNGARPEGDEAAGAESGILHRLTGQWRRARDTLGAHVVQQTLLPVFPRLMGNNEHRLPAGQASLVERLNARLRDLADREGVDLLAADVWAARDGIAAWYDPALWHRAKQEVHPGAAPLYGDLLARLVAARRGRAKKCLVLDLDNTCWGGTIGDDGLDGIQLGPGSAMGEAFSGFQTYARDLSRRGVILAVCSKNDAANALEPFECHPGMVLRRDDIACFAANWTDKATNLRDIAARLNIGLDSLVFADDNPAERDLIRRELPEVAVPELPEDPALFAGTIADAGYFESLGLTAEDQARTGQYRANLAREVAKTEATGLESFLRDLDMELRWSRWHRDGLKRIVQLTGKTNQFNLTAQRLDEAAVLDLIQDENALTLSLRLLDRFGDNGIAGLIAGRFDAAGKDIVLDLWLMSCRVLGRGMEQAALNLAVAEAKRLGAERLIGIYRPSAKNGMVRDHYENLGFAPMGGGRWFLPVADVPARPVFMRIREG